VILEQALGLAELVGRLGFEIFIGTGLDRAAKDRHRLLILLKLNPALSQPV